MPTREQTISDALQIFKTSSYPLGLSSSTAWLGIYQALLWFEPVNHLSFTSLPHIIDADKLRPSTAAKKKKWKSPTVWQQRAQKIADYLSDKLGCSVSYLPQKVDRLMRLPAYKGLQRQNTLGIAFAGLVKRVLETFGSGSVNYRTEVEAKEIFPGISFPGRSGAPRIDLLATVNGIPKAILSSKWSMRHDRLNDITNECPIYKAAYNRIYRQEEGDELTYYVVTNEFDPSRLNKILDDDCVNGVVHVHKAALVNVCELNGRLDELLDLPDLIELTHTW